MDRRRHSVVDLTPFQWFQVIVSLVTLLGGVAVWFWGRDRVVAVSGAVHDERIAEIGRRVASIEAVQEDAHLLRRDMNRDIGGIDKRLTKIEVHVDDHARRLERVEAP